MNYLSMRHLNNLSTLYRFEIATYLLQVATTLCNHLSPSLSAASIFDIPLITQIGDLKSSHSQIEQLEELCSRIEKSSCLTFEFDKLDSNCFYRCNHLTLLQTILETFIDGILIVTDLGEWVHANESARQICRRLNRDNAKDFVPKEIWYICQFLMENSDTYPEEEVTVEAELTIGKLAAFRVRTRWLSLHEVKRPYILVTLTDQLQSIRNLAITDARKYGLTPSETKVWELYCAKCSYKEIASKLYISENTVKKHMKSIHSKRKLVEDGV